MAKAPVAKKPATKSELFAGKGDHDDDGAVGGATDPVPEPTQAEADEIRTESEALTTADEPAATEAAPAKKPKAKAPTIETPFPTQADLDAMKAGTYRNREFKTE